MRAILLRATLITAVFASFIAVDVLIFYPLHLFGVLDASATIFNVAAFVLCIPGYLLGVFLDLNAESLRDLPFLLSGPIFTSGMLWIGVVVVLWLCEKRRSVVASRQSPEESKATSRRRFIVGALGTTAAAGVGLPGLYALYYEPRWPIFRRLRFPIADLPNGLVGLRVIQLTDLHLGPYISESYLSWVVDRCNELNPDVVVLTGDFVFSSPRYIPRVAEILSRLRPSLGMVAVLGNHDWYENGPRMRAALEEQGIPVIDNSRRWLTSRGFSQNDPGEGALCVAGVGDLWADYCDIGAALEGIRDETPRILLSHNPDFAETADAVSGQHRLDLMLSGHTHGGQVSLPARGIVFASSAFGTKYASGLVRGPAFPVFVCPGVGIGSLPLRFGVRPEVAVIELSRSE